MKRISISMLLAVFTASSISANTIDLALRFWSIILMTERKKFLLK